MLKIIGDGWCKLTLTEARNGKTNTLNAVPSYITDVPADTLRAFLHYFKYGTGTVFYDEESSSNFSIVLNRDGLYVMGTNDNKAPERFKMDLHRLAEELCQDIEADINGWAEFAVLDPEHDTSTIKKNKEVLLQMVAELRQTANPWYLPSEADYNLIADLVEDNDDL